MTLTRFDRWAPHYDDAALQPLFRAAHDRVLQESAGMVAADRILDIGCGTGRLMDVAAHQYPGALVVGVDVSAAMLSVAVSGRPDRSSHRFVRAAAERLPFADATFDLVLSTCSLRHWADPDAGVREIGRVLARGGVVALADLFDSGPRTVIGSIAGRRPRVPPALQPCLAGANLTAINVVRAAGHGPIIEITVVLATRPVGGAATCRSRLGLDEANADGVPGQFEPVAQAELL